MKKIIIILFFLSILFIFSNHSEEILIPNNAIRFRVIANSNSIEDQTKKIIVKNNIERELYTLIGNVSTTEEAKKIMEDNLDNIDKMVAKYQVPYQISYGLNYFPTKNYKGVLYQAGNYESLVITLGNGEGSNFWCVLFPPLCLLDNEENDVSDVKYQFYIKKILDKF